MVLKSHCQKSVRVKYSQSLERVDRPVLVEVLNATMRSRNLI